MSTVHVELYASSRSGLRAQATAAADEMLHQGSKVLVLGLDALPILDAAALSAMILALRKVREVGGSVRLVAVNAGHRRSLAATGLDRIFEIFATVEAAQTPTIAPRPPARANQIASAVALTILCVAALFAQVRAQDQSVPRDETAPAVIAHLIGQNADLQDYEADVHLDVAMRSFPFLHPKLVGKAFFTRPDRYEVVFNHAPWYAKGLEHIYTDVGAPSTWDKRFVITADGERTVAGQRQIALRMVQRVRGMIDHQEVYVNPVGWTVDEMDFIYYNGGRISIQQTFALIAGFSLLSSQRATIAIPHVQAVATSSFDGFRTNVKFGDALFAKSSALQQ